MPNTPVTRADLAELTAGVGALTAAFETTEKFAKRTRQILITAVVAGLISLITAVVAVVAVGNSQRAQDKSDLNATILALVQQYLEQGCAAGNEGRGAEHALWDGLFAEDKKLAEKTGEKISKDEQVALDRIAKLVDKAYPQRDCSKVKDGQVAPASPTPGAAPK